MNVLHVTLSFAHGGRRQAIAALCRALVPLGVENRLCCLENFESTPAERASCFVDSIELHRRNLLDRNAARRLREYCFAHAIDIVHTHDAASQAASAIALPLRRPPMLMTFHRTRNFESARPRDRLRNALVGLRAGAVVTASQERLLHYLRNNRVSSGKVTCIPLGVDLARFRPDATLRSSRRAQLGIGAGQLLIGTIGHFGPEKGADLAIDAFQIFCEKHPDCDARLIVLGTGNDEQERFVRSRVSPEFSARIHFAGFQPSPEEWLPAFDVLLHGARSEAFGLVLAEAMACGVPIVATRVGGIPEIVDERSGVLAPTADADALAIALDRALTDPEWRGSASQHALQRARTHYCSEQYARRYFELYSSLVKSAAVA